MSGKQDKPRSEADAELEREILKERNRINARRRKDKRKTAEQVRVAVGDPMAPLGRDKMKVFRPLYNVQTMSGLDTDFVFAYSVTPTLSDSGHLVPMIDQMATVTGQPLKEVLTDSGYPRLVKVWALIKRRTKSSPGQRISSSRVPCWTIRPERSRTICSPRRAASARS